VSLVSLSADEARRMALRAQGLLGAPDRRGNAASVGRLLRRVGAVQLDTISVLARSHELVAYARLGAIGRETVERAFWGGGNGLVRRDGHPGAVEYWAHAACLLPVEEWPSFAFRRRAYRLRTRWWRQVPEAAIDEVLRRLRADGPLTATQLGGAKAGGDWWDWSHTKVAVEWLLAVGEVVCVQRRGWKRVYDLPDRALPAAVLGTEPDDETCVRRLVGVAGRALGVATTADLSDYYRLSREQVDGVVADTGLVPATVAGWQQPAWAAPEALSELDRRGRHRTTLLSPFDSLVWDRRRTRRLFGFTHALEAYKPRAQRDHGYYVMPLLTGGRLRGRVDPKRVGGTLVAQRVSVEPAASAAAVDQLAQALREAAEWVGCAGVTVEQVEPSRLAAPLAQALARS
jgi:uncharacterized protein